MINEEDFNIIAYPTPTICHGQALLDHIRRTTNMLTVSLFRGTDENHERLVKNVPQDPPRPRRLIFFSVIHEEGADPDVNDAKVLLYQEIDDPSHYWLRKETCNAETGRTNYSETDSDDGLTALGGFETSVRLMLDRLLTRRVTA
jgi:hypothetical protein